MPRASLIGSRIRERRILKEIRQTDLAKSVGISPAYLNLIEHNRRRIGGKLLLDIAEVLQVELALLSEGAEAAVLSALQKASADQPGINVEVERLEEFAGRFPGWAQLVAHQDGEIESLKNAVEVLNDRLSHDPFLAAALHEVISTVSSIRSSASILVESDDIEKEWRDRFHRNIFEDSGRLADTSESLVGYLDPAQDESVSQDTPLDNLEKLLADQDFFVQKIESKAQLGAAHLSKHGLDKAPSLDQPETDQFLMRHRSIVETIPSKLLEQAEAQTDDPAEMATICQVSIPDIFHRLAFRPVQSGDAQYGYLSSDMAGAFLSKRSVEGFSLPRLGVGCTLWPMYAALAQPNVPVVDIIKQAGRGAEPMMAYAIAVPETPQSFSQKPRYVAHMLLKQIVSSDADPKLVGVNCRICPIEKCSARREASILSNGF